MSSPGQNPTPSSVSTQSTRQKSDPAWAHVSEGIDPKDGKKTYTCLYCQKICKGGGINRMKQHLAGKRGEVNSCAKVPHDVRFQMNESLKSIVSKKQHAQQTYESNNPYGPSMSQFEGDMDGEEECQEIPHPPSKKRIATNASGSSGKGKGKGNERVGIGTYFAPRTTPGSQPSIKSALANKEALWRADMAVARFVYDTCIPINALNSVYYQPMIDAIAAIGPGYKGPNYHAMRTNLLKDAKKEVRLFTDSWRSTWAESGCTIMGDGWTDGRHRTLINFLVYCPKGVLFIKSVDASNIVKNAVSLFKLFEEIIEWVGSSNVVHMVTDNASNYVAAGRLINERYKSINWSPCACHCLNLIISDIAKMEHVTNLAKKASKITIFVYNHIFLLNWLRNRPNWKEIIRPGATRFATTFIALHSLYEHMYDLQALVTSKDFIDSRYAKDRRAKDVVFTVLDARFWNDCLIIVKVVEPLIRLLRIADSDEKPSIGYIYEGMYRTRMGIKNLFKNRRAFYKPYTKIIKERWDRQLRQSIHAAAYWLNPAFQYDQATFSKKPEVMRGLLDVIETKSDSSSTKLLEETRIFRDRFESFGRELALTTSKTTQPDEWWKLFGHSTPNLQKLAIRILSQTSSSSGCERNWSVFERIHSKRRNRLEHQRLNDLVYVHYNLRLKNRNLFNKRNYDPIDYESIDKTDFWIVEDDEPPLLDYDELENMLYEDSTIPRHERKRQRPRGDIEEDEIEIQDGIDLGSFSFKERSGDGNNDEHEH